MGYPKIAVHFPVASGNVCFSDYASIQPHTFLSIAALRTRDQPASGRSLVSFKKFGSFVPPASYSILRTEWIEHQEMNYRLHLKNCLSPH